MIDIKTRIQLKETGKFIKYLYKSGKNTYYVFDDNSKDFAKNIIGKPVIVYCDVCNCGCDLKLYNGKHSPLKKEKHLCFKCLTTGENNPFYGKKHKKNLKEKLSKERKGTWYVGNKNSMWGRNIFQEKTQDEVQRIKNKISQACSGERNGFYGKKHTIKTIKIINKKNKVYRESLSEQDKLEYSKKLSDAQKSLQLKDPETYRANKIKAGYKSHIAQFKNKEMNNIEQIVKNELKKRNLKMKFSVIFNHKQYDFGNKENKILLEVHGDYWHGNPLLYGDNKIPLNDIQRNKIKIDAEKKEMAEKYGFKLFTIWESEIKNKDFKILDEIRVAVGNIIK